MVQQSIRVTSVPTVHGRIFLYLFRFPRNSKNTIYFTLDISQNKNDFIWYYIDTTKYNYLYTLDTLNVEIMNNFKKL